MRKILPSTASDIHEYQELRGWGTSHYLKAKITVEEFDAIRKELNYVNCTNKKQLIIPKPIGFSHQPDFSWWNPSNEISTMKNTYYDPSCDKMSERILKYEDGYLYYYFGYLVD